MQNLSTGKEVVIHKTFHNYTVRAKQGGSQSAKDNQNSTAHPKSSGASLRRYNEQSQRQVIFLWLLRYQYLNNHIIIIIFVIIVIQRARPHDAQNIAQNMTGSMLGTYYVHVCEQATHMMVNVLSSFSFKMVQTHL